MCRKSIRSIKVRLVLKPRYRKHQQDLSGCDIKSYGKDRMSLQRLHAVSWALRTWTFSKSVLPSSGLIRIFFLYFGCFFYQKDMGYVGGARNCVEPWLIIIPTFLNVLKFFFRQKMSTIFLLNVMRVNRFISFISFMCLFTYFLFFAQEYNH